MTARTFTHPSVFEGIASGADWADPVMNPEEIDWAGRQARAAIPFQVVDGRPVNPCEKTGIVHGRNEFGHWGEQLMADALVTAVLYRHRYLLVVERDDGYGWAVPGGHVEPREDAPVAALRELREETCLLTAANWVRYTWRPMEPRYVPDPRASDEAWAVTVPVHVNLGEVAELPPVTGGDDARRAEWVPADTFGGLRIELHTSFGGDVFAAHVAMLAGFLGTEG